MSTIVQDRQTGGELAVAAAPAALVDRAAGRLMERKPAENQIAIEGKLAKIAGAPLVVEVAWRHPEGDKAYEMVTKLTRPRGITAEQIASMVSTIELGMAPAPITSIAAELTRLAMLTASRAGEGREPDAKLAAYAEELRAYPADAVLQVLRSGEWRFFPAWAELKTRLDRICHRRRRLLEIIRGWKPWGLADEIAHLERCADRARWDARTLADSDPDRSSAAAEACAAFEDQVARLRETG